MLHLVRLTDGEDSFNLICPFCGDERGKMNACVRRGNRIKNVYHCFGCGAEGNMLTLYCELMGITGEDCFKVAYREIRERLARGGYSSNYAGSRTRKAAVEAEPADSVKRNQVYTELLKLLQLSQGHSLLLKERGLTEEAIKRFRFCSTPVYGTEALARRLLQKDLSLSGVPGFYLNDRGNWDIAFYKKHSGYLCPVPDVDRNLIGFQIRLDQPLDGRKYIWLSSPGREKGASSGSPAAFFGDPRDKTVCVTDGVLKALIAHEFSGLTFIGNPGVNNYKGLDNVLTTLADYGVKEVIDYYDMDRQMKIVCDHNDKACAKCGLHLKAGDICPHKEKKRNEIRKGSNRLYQMCEEHAIRYRRKSWDLDADGTWAGNYKGIDDYWKSYVIQQRRMKNNE